MQANFKNERVTKARRWAAPVNNFLYPIQIGEIGVFLFEGCHHPLGGV